jgi:MYXO-CTERM domain-containing protein
LHHPIAMLSHMLTLALISVPAPPECPWTYGMIEPLMPGGVTVPTNGSFWLRSYSEVDDFAITDQTTSSTIAFDLLETDLIATGGRLIELRPRELLRPNAEYQLIAGPFGYQTQIRTSSESDTAPPAVPIVTGTRPISSPYDVCQTAGIIIDIADPGEPLIYLIDDPNGTTLELAQGMYFGGIRVLPTDPNESVRFDVVALDYAGNRSDSTPPIDATAGALPQVQGKDPRDPFYAGGNREPGCDCTTSSRTNASWLALLVVLRLVRRRVPRNDSRSSGAKIPTQA